MSDNDRLDVLLDRWEEIEDRGGGASAEEVCSDCPELVDDLKRQIRRLRAIDDFLSTSLHSGEAVCSWRAENVVAWGRYRPVRFHDKGGLGEVFLGLDTELKREVALKRIQIRYAANPEARSRFLREAEITGRLEHPGIVPVYGLVENDDGGLCYAMRFIRGRTFREAIDDFHRAEQPGRASGERVLAFQKLLRSFLTVCQTVAYAHSHGIVHRDIKPANIMLESYDETLVVDWGLAKAIEERRGGDSAWEETSSEPAQSVEDQLRTMGIKGSPAYMSPEQAAGRWNEVGPASDIYSLGATLYVLLTGRIAIEGENLIEVIERIQRGDFRPPRQLKYDVPAALEAICLKAMQTAPEKRYASALDLAADIEHWLADEPVSAWTEPWTVKTRRWLRRHRTLMSTAAAAVLVAVVTLTGATLKLLDKNVELADKNVELDKEKKKEQNARLEATAKAKEAKDKADKLAIANRRLEQSLYLSGIRLADRELAQSNVPEAEKALQRCPAYLRGPEWYYLRRLANGQQQVFPADAAFNGIVRFSPDGKWLAVSCGDRKIRVYDAETGQVKHSFVTDSAPVADMAFSPDGRWLAAAAVNFRVWDLTTGKLVHTLDPESGYPRAVAFGASGKEILGAASFLGFVLPGGPKPTGMIVWDAQTGRRLRSMSGNLDASIVSAAFSPDANRLAWVEGYTDPLGNLPHRVRVWDTKSGNDACVIEKGQAGPVRALAFSPNGTVLATARMDGTVKLWNTADGKELRTLYGHSDEVRAIAFAPNGRVIATAGKDRAVKLWSAETGREMATLRGHSKPVNSLAFSPDGSRLASVGDEKSLCLWAMKTPGVMVHREDAPFISDLAVSPDGLEFATGSMGVQVWDTATGQQRSTLPRRLFGLIPGANEQDYSTVTYRPDGKCVAIGGRKDVRVCDPGSGRIIRSLPFGATRRLLYSPDGRWLAAVNEKEKAAAVFDAETGEKIASFEQADEVMAVDFSRDGTRLAMGSRDATIVLWSLKDMQKLHTLRGHGGWIMDLAFSPDGQRLASASADETVRIWGVASGQTEFTLTGHSDYVSSIAFNRDGTRLASTSRDRTVKIWDIASGELLLTLGRDGAGHREWIKCVAFAAGDQYLISAGGGFSAAEILIWDMRP